MNGTQKIEKMYDIQFGQLEDGTVTLEQQRGVDEPCVIHLHPEQVLFIARRLCGMSSAQANLVADLDRRLKVLAGRICAFTSDDLNCSEITGANWGPEIWASLQSIADLAIEFTSGLTPDRAPVFGHGPSNDQLPHKD